MYEKKIFYTKKTFVYTYTHNLYSTGVDLELVSIPSQTFILKTINLLRIPRTTSPKPLSTLRKHKN